MHQTIGQHVLLFDEIGELIDSACDSSLSSEIHYCIKQKVNHILEAKTRVVVELTIKGKPHQLVLLPLGSQPLLGVLTILSELEISEVDITALEHACTIIALERVKEQAIYDTQQRLQGEFITNLLSGKMDETLIQKAKHLNFDPNRNYMALLIDLTNLRHKQGEQMDGIIRHFIKIANQIFLETCPKGMVVRNQDQIVVLLSFGARYSSSSIMYQTKESVRKFQKEIMAKNWSADISIGIGRVKPGLFYVHKSLEEAMKCLQFIRSYQFENKVLSYTDLGVQRLILQNSEEELKDFIQEVLGPLLEYEQARKGDLLTTLFVFLESNQNGKIAAETLHVHPNTLNYRIKRIEDILSIDLTDSKQLLNVHLAINVYQYIKDDLNYGMQISNL